MNSSLKNKIQFSEDVYYMKKTIQLAKRGKYTTAPNPNVGCIIIQKKKIVGIGWHQKAGENHAEVNAINMAGPLSKNGTAYISLEPCNHFGKTPPCCHLIIKSGITRVVIAMLDPNPKMSGKSVMYLKKNGIKVTVGILCKESKNINLGFLKRMETGLPWIQLKMAISMDGKIAMPNGNSKWITSKAARKDTHQLRALSAAILSTSSTILKDNPKLTARCNINKIFQKKYVQPKRIILDSKNRIQPTHQIIQENSSEVWLIRLYHDQKYWPNHVKQIILPKYKNYINLKKLLQFIGKQQINTVWIECGTSLCSNMIKLNLIDELILYIAPKMLGNLAKPLYFDTKNIHLNQVNKFIFTSIKHIGPDIRIKLKPKFTC
ncbi:bifunctional diaminohydroxyphosphoribosylaminopyrimidine deaminase/5-amino-6-(5-phosphoribosylamino)uracil reductase RibD [Buchnera aphidicola (Takecallis taiwana)]|uniref:bifunctional diaminohydroxyphosphoribosylaminopyrimidine deaminase/5-amino-6-(5-phosphoribosylamino)uracil reductase RibD n=1 Tax=Buchnera aphidicola TaxID=9 RepID=UPI0031B68FFD